MPSDPLQDDLTEIWHSQPTEAIHMSIEEIRTKARQFQSTIQIRNGIEYAAGLIVVILCSVSLVHTHNFLLRAGFILCIAGIVVVGFQLRSRGSGRGLAKDMGLTTSVGFYRSELERQRDLLRNVGSWYLLPLTPGLVAVTLAGAVDRHGDTTAAGIAAAIGLSVNALLFYAVWKVNRIAADRIQRSLDELGPR